MQVQEARHRFVRYLNFVRDLSPHSVRAYEADVTALERFMGPDAPVSAIDRDGLVTFIEMQRAAGLAPASIRRRASGIRTFCRWLVGHGLLGSDPWVGIMLPSARSRKLPRSVRADDLDRMLRMLRRAACVDADVDPSAPLKNPHQTTTLLAVTLMLATGVRVSELVSIRCQDVDLTGRTVRILGKGRRERQVFLTNEWLAMLIGAYLIARVALGIEHDRLLFNRCGEPLTTSAVRSRLSKAALSTATQGVVTPHMLRHTAATRLIEAGVDIRLIQRLLGHASLSTTEIYTHVSDRALQRVLSDADVLGAAMPRR